MFSDHAENQVFGETVLNLGLIAGAVFLLLATLWTGAGPQPVMQASVQPVKQVVVVAHHNRVS